MWCELSGQGGKSNAYGRHRVNYKKDYKGKMFTMFVSIDVSRESIQNCCEQCTGL